MLAADVPLPRRCGRRLKGARDREGCFSIRPRCVGRTVAIPKSDAPSWCCKAAIIYGCGTYATSMSSPGSSASGSATRNIRAATHMPVMGYVSTLMSIQSAFEKAGIILQDEDAGGGAFRNRCEVQPTISSIVLRLLSMGIVCCATTTRPGKVTTAASGKPRGVINLPIPKFF
jgi:hypothetical protein